MDQISKATMFKQLHQPGNPLILYNIWDFGSASTVAMAGAKALATGSWSVAAAQGYDDGEKIPKDDLFALATKIASRIDLPLSVDFEGGYAAEPEQLEDNIGQLIKTGAIGINFEDQIINRDDLYPINRQLTRLSAIRKASISSGIPLFVNARTDLFLKQSDPEKHASLIDAAIERGLAYADAGADGFFVPGLTDLTLIARICAAVPLPVNILKREGLHSNADFAQAGVGRISYGHGPYRIAMANLTRQVRNAQIS